MMKMTVKESVKSKGMMGGYFMVALGVYLVSEKNLSEGLNSIGLGFGILGIRDAQ